MGRSSDARERLIQAARQIIFAHSYLGVSVDELCASAGVAKSSFYHFFSSKQELLLAAIDSQQAWFEQEILQPIFYSSLPPHERLLTFFTLTLEKQQTQKVQDGYMHGCPAGNLTLEMSTQDEVLRVRIANFFRSWTTYFVHMLSEARAEGSIPVTLNIETTAEALLAYFEGVMLLAKGRNDPALFQTLRSGALALMQYQGNTFL